MWYEQAAAAGNTETMYKLGLFYFTSIDPSNVDEGLRWLRKAAQSGHVRACLTLAERAIMREPSDLEEFSRWSEKAVAAGYNPDP